MEMNPSGNHSSTTFMRSLFSHFIAALICITIFSGSATIDGFSNVLQTMPQADLRVSLIFTGTLNFVYVCLLTISVLAPVTSIANYLFTHKWPWPFYIQIPALAALLIVYLAPWSLFFGRQFFVALEKGTLILMVPLLIYWVIFRTANRDYAA